MSFRAVVFDLFGTLVSSAPWRDYEPVMDQMADCLGLPREEFRQQFDRETLEARQLGQFTSIHENLGAICEAMGRQPSAEDLRQAVELRHAFTLESLEPRPESLPAIAKLKEKGLKIGLLSDCSPDVPAVWPSTALAGHFDAAVFSSDVGLKKPNPEIYRLLCGRLAVEPGDCLYVGDGGSYELSGAQSLGMTPVLIRPPGERDLEHFRPEAGHWTGAVITSLAEVPELVASAG